ncbi:hypothetical protein VTL71DRAFT_2129 [Oculimacula yallundae]|uniref:SGNH hydrolase-type esterase domain-containing protein n=1 Tax=Oculimacula yallundae TaxID=86028 RepID=A0ABR4C815_9HELO
MDYDSLSSYSSWSSSVSTDSENRPPPPKFILFGDDITHVATEQTSGFDLVAEIQAALSIRVDVINRGYAGYNTDNALEIITSAIPTPEEAAVKFLVVWFGSNENNKNSLHGKYVTPSQFRANVVQIITHPSVSAHLPSIHIILITPPPIDECMLANQMRVNWRDVVEAETRKAKDVKRYRDIVKEVGKGREVPVLDCWGLFMKKAGWKEGEEEELPGADPTKRNEVLAELLTDGLHLTPAGYRLVFDDMMALIKYYWPPFTPYINKMSIDEIFAWEKVLFNYQIHGPPNKGQPWDVNNDKRGVGGGLPRVVGGN